VRINTERPSIGVIISQQTEFDFREQEAKSTTNTDAEGKFSISDLSEGNYNIVVKKNGYGFKIFYNYEVSNGSNNLNTATANNLITLYPEVSRSGFIIDNLTLQSDHHYIFTGNTNLSSDVVIEPGAYIRLAGNTSLHFSGHLSVQGELGNFVHFTSNDGFFNTTSSVQPYNQITIDNTATLENDLLEGCLFSYGQYGLQSFSNCSLKNTVFKTIFSSFQASQINNTSIENCLFQNSQTSVDIHYIPTVSIMKNIFYKNRIGMYMSSIGTQTMDDGGIIKNNYFQNNSNIALQISYNSYPLVMYNTITNNIAGNSYGIQIHQDCSFHISYNRIFANICVYMDGAYVYSPLQNNNLICPQTGFCLQYISLHNPDLEAMNNYWGVNNIILVPDKIYDKQDMQIENVPFWEIASFVLYDPAKYFPINSAGVQP